MGNGPGLWIRDGEFQRHVSPGAFDRVPKADLLFFFPSKDVLLG